MQEQYVTDHVEPEISHEERRKKRKAEDALNKVRNPHTLARTLC